MATRRVVTRVDDLDGSPDAHTVRFGLDGDAYEIDLTDSHAQPFRELLAPHVSEGRRLTRAAAPTPASTSTSEPPPGADGAHASRAGEQSGTAPT